MLMLLGGCAGFDVPPTSATGAEELYMVTSRRAYFYQFGPAQGSGPDFVLARGQLVKMIKRDFGFSQIKTTDGDLGYVATSDVAPAPADVVRLAQQHQERQKKAPKTRSGGSRPPPSFAQPNDSALPDRQTLLPSPGAPAPSFRY
jgi:hypothetical protein